MIIIEQNCEYTYPSIYHGKLSIDLNDKEYEEFKKLSFDNQCEYLQENGQFITDSFTESQTIEIYNKSYPIKIKQNEK